MRLLHTETLQFCEYLSPNDAPAYIIASHRWLDGEVSYQEFNKSHAEILAKPGISWQEFSNSHPEILTKAGMHKILRFCDYIKDWRTQSADGEIPQYLWIDTCCINKDSSAELQEAITSMFEWYAQAWCCLAWLHDVEVGMLQALDNSVWFTRGWTLQELLAPKTVILLDEQWRIFGHKSSTAGLRALISNQAIDGDRLGPSLNRSISQITGIAEAILWDYATVRAASMEERQLWMRNRQTTRREDRAYCMLGICEVFMPLNYGEGSNAEQRLERKIRKRAEHQQANSQFQPLSLSEKEQILNRAVFNWDPPKTDQPALKYTQVHANNALGPEGLKLLMLLAVWLSHPGQDKFMANKWAKTPQHYQDLQKHLQNDRQQRFVLKFPPSGNIEGSYVTKRDFKSPSGVGTNVQVGSPEWSQMMLETIDEGFRISDLRTAEHGCDVYSLAAEQFVSTMDQLAALRECLLTHARQRYYVGAKVGAHSGSDLSKALVFRRIFNPDSPRVKLVADLLFRVLSRLSANETVTLQQVINHREVQAHGVMITEVTSCLRNDGQKRFEVTPVLPPAPHFVIPAQYRVRNNDSRHSAIQDEAQVSTKECRACQRARAIDGTGATCDQKVPTCTPCASKGTECWYTPPNKCIWCTDMRKDCDRGEKCSNCAPERLDCRYRGGLTHKDSLSKCVWCTDMCKDCDREKNCATCKADGVDCRWR